MGCNWPVGICKNGLERACDRMAWNWIELGWTGLELADMGFIIYAGIC